MSGSGLRHGRSASASLATRLWPQRCRLAVAIATVLLGLLAISRAAHAQDQTPAGPALANVKSWGYQLTDLDVATLAASPYELLVIDYTRYGSEDARLSRADLDKLKKLPDGRRRFVLAYMSIGEAEEYRYYWRWHWGILWGLLAPSWRGKHNPEWEGNYAVRYWQPGWQSIILGSSATARDGYLDRILDAGFDGVYLDKIDSSLESIGKENPNARADMVTFVHRIAERSRARVPGFLVVPQNGEELLSIAGYRSIIDGLGKEDLLYGEFANGKPNPPDTIAMRAKLLAKLALDRKPVFAVEYLDDVAEIAEARRRLLELGLVPHFADRDLARLRIGDAPTHQATGGRGKRN